MYENWMVLVIRWLSVNPLDDVTSRSLVQKWILNDGINVCLIVTGGTSEMSRCLNRPWLLAESCLIDSIYIKKKKQFIRIKQTTSKSMLTYLGIWPSWFNKSNFPGRLFFILRSVIARIAIRGVMPQAIHVAEIYKKPHLFFHLHNFF